MMENLISLQTDNGYLLHSPERLKQACILQINSRKHTELVCIYELLLNKILNANSSVEGGLIWIRTSEGSVHGWLLQAEGVDEAKLLKSWWPGHTAGERKGPKTSYRPQAHSSMTITDPHRMALCQSSVCLQANQVDAYASLAHGL